MKRLLLSIILALVLTLSASAAARSRIAITLVGVATETGPVVVRVQVVPRVGDTVLLGTSGEFTVVRVVHDLTGDVPRVLVYITNGITR